MKVNEFVGMGGVRYEDEEALGFDQKTFDAAKNALAEQIAKEFISYAQEMWEDNKEDYEDFKQFTQELKQDPIHWNDYFEGHIAEILKKKADFYMRRYFRAPARAFNKG